MQTFKFSAAVGRELCGEKIVHIAYQQSKKSRGMLVFNFIVIGLLPATFGWLLTSKVYRVMFLGDTFKHLIKSNGPDRRTIYNHIDSIVGNSPIFLIIAGIFGVFLLFMGCLALFSVIIQIFGNKENDLSNVEKIDCYTFTPTRLIKYVSGKIETVYWKDLSSNTKVLGRSLYLQRKNPERDKQVPNVVLSYLAEPEKVQEICKELLRA